MDMNLLGCLIFSLVLVVYLTQLPVFRLNAFGDFLKKIFTLFPVKQITETFLLFKSSQKDEVDKT